MARTGRNGTLTGQNSGIEENLSRMLDGPYGTKRDLIGHTEQKGDIDKNSRTGQPETGLKRAISSCEPKCVSSLSISSVIKTKEQHRVSIAHKLRQTLNPDTYVKALKVLNIPTIIVNHLTSIDPPKS